uniref:Uncharacterized protein n=1 Tax=Cyanothece sp. (strain PCC 7425 / ATCC 29141) TaxID=395961 RepID=B8HZG2_CYAP4
MNAKIFSQLSDEQFNQIKVGEDEDLELDVNDLKGIAGGAIYMKVEGIQGRCN